MKIKLELNLLEDGRMFLNFWDAMHGNDVVSEIKDGNLYVDGEMISLTEYINRIKESTSYD